MARAAARRIPLVGTAVVAAPILQAASQAGLSASNLTNMETWKQFANHLVRNFTGYDASVAAFDGPSALRTYLPIAGYLAARRFGLSKPISRVLGKLGLRF